MKRLILSIATALAALSLGAQEPDTPKINKKNLVIKEWNTDVRTNTRVLDHVTTYSAEGRKVEETEYNADGQKWRKRYEYGADGKCTKEMVYDEKNRLVTVKKYEYNEFARKKKQYNYDAKGKLKSIKIFEYKTQDA